MNIKRKTECWPIAFSSASYWRPGCFQGAAHSHAYVRVAARLSMNQTPLFKPESVATSKTPHHVAKQLGQQLVRLLLGHLPQRRLHLRRLRRRVLARRIAGVAHGSG